MQSVRNSVQPRNTTWWSRCLLSGLLVAGLNAVPTLARSTEQIVAIKTSDPASTVSLLSAPHTGKIICKITSATRVEFIKRSDHGPHKFANVEVLDGTCAGQVGYVGWHYLEPEPQKD
jgi:hypothetical protein